MRITEYLRLVKAVLEALPAPDIVPIIDRSEVRAAIKTVAERVFNTAEYLRVNEMFLAFNPRLMNEEFNQLAQETNVPWAYWKLQIIPDLMRSALAGYLAAGPLECDVREWRRLGALMIYNLFMAEWPARTFEKREECVICKLPLFRTLATPCGHEFHAACLEAWIISNHPTCPLCRREF